MAKGKTTCRILKEIRRQIAEANDIEYVVEECQYKGDCKGTCPKCEAEVMYLESQLHKRQMLGKAVVVAGLSLGVIPAMAQEVSAVETKVATTVAAPNKEVAGKYIIRGRVIENNNDVVIGCSVCVRESSKMKYSAHTGFDGNFALGVDTLPVNVEIAYPGYETLIFQVTEENYNQFFLANLAPDDDLIIGEVVYSKRKMKRMQRREAKKAKREAKVAATERGKEKKSFVTITTPSDEK